MIKEKKTGRLPVQLTDDPNKYPDDHCLRIYCCDSLDEDMAKDCAGFVFQKDMADYYAVLLSPAGERRKTVTG